jgi:hypothetical protein
MNTYTFVLKTKDGEKCSQIPKAIIERNYGPLEEDAYIFYTLQNQVFYLSDHPRFKEKKDSP